MFFKDFYFQSCGCAWSLGHVCAHENRCTWRPEEGFVFSGAGFSITCETGPLKEQNTC